MADGTRGWGNSLSSKSRDSVNHARGIVNIGTLNIETGYRQDLQGWRKGILNFLSFLFSLSLSLSLESILTRYETRRFRFPFLFHREIHRYRLYLIDRAESEFHDVLRRRRRLRVGGSHKYNLDSSDHMPLESRPFFFPARRFMAGFPYCSVSKYQGEKCLDVYIEKWKKC